MFVLHIYTREDAYNLGEGYFCGMLDNIPDIASEVFPNVKCFDTTARAEQMAKLIMALQPWISEYRIEKFDSHELCPTFECTAYLTNNCADYEGCIGCNVYGNCNFCSKENCGTGWAYYKCFAKKHGRNNILPSGIVLH